MSSSHPRVHNTTELTIVTHVAVGPVAAHQRRNPYATANLWTRISPNKSRNKGHQPHNTQQS